MKNIILTLIAAVAMTVNVFAQQDNRQRGQRMNPEEMINRRTEMMVQKYGLDEKQAAALKALNEKSMTQMRGQRGPQEKADTAQARRPRGERGAENGRVRGDRQRGGERMQGNGQRGGMRNGAGMEEYNAELKKIMTEDQYKAYEKDMQNMRGQFGGMRGGQRGGQRPDRRNNSND